MKPAIHCVSFFILVSLLAPESAIQAQISDGSVIAWGLNDHGQCNIPSPNASFTAVAAGSAHSLALHPDGSIVAWGDSLYGQCSVPSPNAGFTAVAAGDAHSLGLRSDGSIVVWGFAMSDPPAPNTGFTTLASTYQHGLGLKTDGSIVGWGMNEYGQCDVPSPNTGFTAVAAGVYHSLGLKADGSIVAWGTNPDGRCTVPSPNAGFIAVSAGGAHSLGLKSDGSIVGWGENTYGQCTVPSPNAGFIAVAAGERHSLGLKASGSIVAWGRNVFGQCNVPSPNMDFVAVAAGTHHSIGLKSISFRLIIVDVPDDQGGQVRVSWRRHFLDSAASVLPATAYDVQRLSSNWQNLTSVAAVQADSYSVILATPDILTLGQPAPYSRYRVAVRTANPSIFYESPPDSGYSIDNIAPPTPPLTIFDGETYRSLAWENPTVQDFKESCLYRGTEPGFVEGNSLLCSASQYWYAENHRALFFYRLRSYDIHGNPSEWSNEVVGRYPTGVPGVPTALRLYPNQPNPFNPLTTIRFDLPETGRVRLAVYDVRGKLIRELVDAELPLGSHSAVWDGKDSAGRAMASGGYFARLIAGGKVETVRMGLVR